MPARRMCVRALSFATGLLMTGVFGAPIARAGAPTRVIELFTSQGCPKCPPADRLIAELARDPGTIALSYSVNYWDYIGWKDTLASPAFTARQHAYAAARGDHEVFTPQVIVDGRSVEPGADKKAILEDSRRLPAREGALRVSMSLSESDGTLHVHLGTDVDAAATPPIGVYVLRVARAATVEIGNGDNSGRRITYTNAVRAMTRLGAWNGRALDLHMAELKSDDESYVVLLQAGTMERPGTILAAAQTR